MEPVELISYPNIAKVNAPAIYMTFGI